MAPIPGRAARASGSNAPSADQEREQHHPTSGRRGRRSAATTPTGRRFGGGGGLRRRAACRRRRRRGRGRWRRSGLHRRRWLGSARRVLAPHAIGFQFGRRAAIAARRRIPVRVGLRWFTHLERSGDPVGAGAVRSTAPQPPGPLLEFVVHFLATVAVGLAAGPLGARLVRAAMLAETRIAGAVSEKLGGHQPRRAHDVGRRAVERVRGDEGGNEAQQSRERESHPSDPGPGTRGRPRRC